MTPPAAIAVFFPPRIVWVDQSAGDSHDMINNARDRYCAEGLVILANDQYVTDAMKIIHYASAFPRVIDPDFKEPMGPVKIPVMVDESMPPDQIKLKNMDTGEEVIMKGIDMVNHPPHYTDGGIETIEYLRAKLSPAEFRGFCKGNALKYLSRAGKKGDEDEDCRKAQWYLDQLTKKSSATS